MTFASDDLVDPLQRVRRHLGAARAGIRRGRDLRGQRIRPADDAHGQGEDEAPAAVPGGAASDGRPERAAERTSPRSSPVGGASA